MDYFTLYTFKNQQNEIIKMQQNRTTNTFHIRFHLLHVWAPMCHHQGKIARITEIRIPAQEDKNACGCITEEAHCGLVLLLQQYIHILVVVQSGILTFYRLLTFTMAVKTNSV